MNIIKYNNIILKIPTPLVTLEKDYIFNNQKIGEVDRIRLIGQLTGKYNELTGAQQELIQTFNQDFKTFEIYENAEKIYEKSGVLVNSITFDEANYNALLNYQINLTARKYDYNVQNPTNQFNISKENNTLNLTHNVSAQGINTSSNNKSNALENAISFVNNFTGLNGIPSLYIENNIGIPNQILVSNSPNPSYNGVFEKINVGGRVLWENQTNSSVYIEAPGPLSAEFWTFYDDGVGGGMISTNPSTNPNQVPVLNWTPNFNLKINSGNFILLEQRESINRLDSSYSIQEIYIKDLTYDHQQSGILRYTIDYTSGAEQDGVSFSIKGSYNDSPINGNFNNLKSGFKNLISGNLYTKLKGSVTGFYNGYINPNPISISINENSGANTIEFSYEYDNLNLPNPYFNYSTNISRDDITQIISINVNAEIIARGGSLSGRYNLAQQSYPLVENKMVEIANNVYNIFIDFSGANYSYPIRKIKSNRRDSPSIGKITMSATFDDKEIPYNFAAEADYSVSKELPVWYFGPNATLQRNNYIFQDFDIHTPLRSTYDTNVKTNTSISKSTAEGIGSTIVPATSEEIRNIKYDFQKEKDGRYRNIKVSREIISTQTNAEFPKSIQ
jgi:hypothetical protein